MAADVVAYKRRRCVFSVTLNDINGDPVVIDAGDIIRVKIGKEGSTPKLDLADDTPTANGSTVTHANPFTVTLDADDLGDTFEAGNWTIEYSLDDAQNEGELLVADVGNFILHDSQLGAL